MGKDDFEIDDLNLDDMTDVEVMVEDVDPDTTEETKSMASEKNSSTVEEEDLEVTKAKNLFRFLAEVKKLSSPAIKDYESYDQVVWINDIPREKGCFLPGAQQSEQVQTAPAPLGGDLNHRLPEPVLPIDVLDEIDLVDHVHQMPRLGDAPEDRVEAGQQLPRVPPVAPVCLAEIEVSPLVIGYRSHLCRRLIFPTRTSVHIDY